MTTLGRALITGIGGFAGSHLAELLVREGAEVHGIVHEEGTPSNLAGVARETHLVRADLRDPEQTLRAARATRPDVVFHLAAQPVPASSWRDPRGTLETNVLGTLDLLEALRELGTVPLVVLASSADVYALGAEGGGRSRTQPRRRRGGAERRAPAREEDLPLREDHPLGPRNPYAASKVAQETLVAQYAAAGVVRSVILRSANQLGPRLSRDLVASAFAAQIAAAEAGGPRVVRVGNLEARRDFVDVRDAARAYQLAATRAESGRVYNLGTGAAVPIRRLLDVLLAESRVRIVVEEDAELVRPDDRPALALDASAFRARTGWAPTVPLERSLRDTLEHWRTRLAMEVRGR